jgi:thymidylate synthase (FAD)
MIWAFVLIVVRQRSVSVIIVKPSAELLWITPNAEQMIELGGRTCYKSEDKITPDSAIKFVKKIRSLQHHSVLEHGVASFKFVCDRGVTHEMVRHRLASYSQESTRYCNYSKCKFGGEIKVIEPPFKKPESIVVWEAITGRIEYAYMKLLEFGESPQMARSILPNCLKTEIVMTCNFREWLHVFALRSSKNKRAHPQIREVMDIAQDILIEQCPAIFKKEV